MQFSEQSINFVFKPNQHLLATLMIKNVQAHQVVFKFKASTANRFIIKPNTGTLSANQEVNVDIIIHKQIAANCQNEKLQIIYGKNLEKNCHSHTFSLRLSQEQARNENLNLTMVVENKQNRIKQLQGELDKFKSISNSATTMPAKESSNFKLLLLVAIILGLLVGFLGPVKIFKKKIR